MGEETYGTLLLVATAANINFMGGIVFHRGKHIDSWFDLKTHSKVIEDGTVGENTYSFLLVFYSNFGQISVSALQWILLRDCDL